MTAIVVMGVSGAGKTTVGRALAARLSWRFLDADDFHPLTNIAKMRRGEPLTDSDRAPWLARLSRALGEHERSGRSVVLACSALKERYRQEIAAGLDDVRWVYLKGDYQTLVSRLGRRAGHFMPASLLDSQLAVLEEPNDAVVIDIRMPLGDAVRAAVRALGLSGPPPADARGPDPE